MAEVVGVVAAAGQFIVQSTKILLFIKDVHDKVQGAPAELKVWRQEIEELQKLVSNVQSSPALQVSNIKPIVDNCNAISDSLCEIFGKLDFDATDRLGRKTWKAIRGLAKEEQIHALFSQIERFKLTLNTQIAVVNL